jgi:hypothetical protein
MSRKELPTWAEDILQVLMNESDSHFMAPMEWRYNEQEEELILAFCPVAVVGGEHDGAVLPGSRGKFHLDLQSVIEMFDKLPAVSISDDELISICGEIDGEHALLTIIEQFSDTEAEAKIVVDKNGQPSMHFLGVDEVDDRGKDI